MRLFNKREVNDRMLIADRGESRINKLTREAVSKTTTQKVVELAWTAGPVTLIASIGGYYLGHGKALPKETLVFFIAYTVIAGVVGLAAHMINRLARGARQEQVEQQVTGVMANLPDRVLQLRNIQLEMLEPDQRRIEAARILLQDVDLGPRWLATAINNLGGSARLVRAAEEIDIYRRAGMHILATDIQASHRLEIEQLYSSHLQDNPALAQSIKAWFEGEGVDPKAGIPRSKYFIERIFAAIDDDDEALMTIDDVEEVFTLLFELLCGRRIPMLAFNYTGTSKLTRETDRIEERRYKYRLARAKAYSRLLAVATFLCDQLDDVSLTTRIGITGNQLLAFCDTNIDSLVGRIKRKEPDEKRLKGVLERALDLYHQAYIANQKTDLEHKEFLAIVAKWKRLIESQPVSEVAFYGDTETRSGLQITEDVIYLSDRKKLQVVQSLSRFSESPHRLHETPINRLQNAKQLAVRIALALDEVIAIRRPEVQRAIDNAQAINMGVFERGLSSQTKIGLGEALAKEIQKDMASAAQALATAIYRYYGLKLDDQSQQQLAGRYGVSLNALKSVYDRKKVGEGGVSDIPSKPIPISRPHLEWRLALARPKH